MSERTRTALLTVLGMVGAALGIAAYVLISGGRLEAGVDLRAYLRAGADLLAGRPVYTTQIGDPAAFAYAPPWAVLAAAISWIPGPLLQAAILALDVLAMRYVGGSWRAVGLILLFPLTPFVLSAGNIELLIAAAIVLAWRGRVEPLVLMAAAKLSPALALPPRQWRRILISGAVLLAITLPWLHLWPEWVAYLLRQPSQIRISLPPPWYIRLPIALVLLVALRRPWAAALAAVIAVPSLYLSSLVMLIAPIRLWLDERAAARREATAFSRWSPSSCCRCTAAVPRCGRRRCCSSSSCCSSAWGRRTWR